MKECCKKYLDEQFGGDADVVAEIYAEYVSSIKEKLDDARQVLAAGDWTRLDCVAHTIKGNALAAGDAEMAGTAIELRKTAALADSTQSAALVKRLGMLSEGL